MIRIVLILLSIIGGIVAVALALLLLLLFIPVRYRFYGRKKEDIYAKSSVSWFFHLLHISFLYEQGEPVLQCRVLGILLYQKRKEQGKEEAAPKDELLKEEPPGEESPLKEPSKKKPSKKKPSKKEPPKKEPPEVVAMERTSPPPEEEAKQEGKSLKKRFERLRLFWQENKAAIGIIFEQTKKLLCSLLPEKIEGTVWFGTGDPCTTGELTGLLAIAYGFYGDKLQLYPDFTQAVFMGELWVAGKIRLFTFLRICITVVLDKNVKRLLVNIKNLKEDL